MITEDLRLILSLKKKKKKKLNRKTDVVVSPTQYDHIPMFIISIVLV